MMQLLIYSSCSAWKMLRKVFFTPSYFFTPPHSPFPSPKVCQRTLSRPSRLLPALLTQKVSPVVCRIPGMLFEKCAFTQAASLCVCATEVRRENHGSQSRPPLFARHEDHLWDTLTVTIVMHHLTHTAFLQSMSMSVCVCVTTTEATTPTTTSSVHLLYWPVLHLSVPQSRLLLFFFFSLSKIWK